MAEGQWSLLNVELFLLAGSAILTLAVAVQSTIWKASGRTTESAAVACGLAPSTPINEERRKNPDVRDKTRHVNDIPIHTVDSYTPDILIRTLAGEYMVAAAALDTQCQLGNWISKRLVEELGMIDSIRHEMAPAQVVTATGEEVESCGTISLIWKLAPNENRVFRGTFFVLSGARHLDVILGQDTIKKEGFLSLNSRKLFAPFATHRKITQSDRDAIAAEEARQQAEKKRLEARRQAAQQQQPTSGSSSGSSNQQQ
ncbi:hypothetical protein EJ04DRAFT_571584 [Polyplosphaeria fusca]|uniref:Uncharacterized protein n=1 Tax=Polyplosphaeria fusca TaxID=682080 RepID=A0A9P4R9D9_9PLEO|nr:hypothetical protein EJ04DRAFT_571584 [Polyplosphaeria fusca]